MVGIISFVFVLGLIVLVHELGHFLVAKHYGILCHQFAIGMGPVIWSKRVNETLYSIRLIPIGGYVAMAGEEVEKDILSVDSTIGLVLDTNHLVKKIVLKPETAQADIVGVLKSFDLYKGLTIELETDKGIMRYDVDENASYLDDKHEQRIAPYDRCLESKSKFARFATMAAGAIMNFILAFALMFIIGLIQGERTYSNEIAMINPDSPAEESGLQVGDEIVDVNDVAITDWDDVTAQLQDLNGEPVTITIKRGEEYETFIITPVVTEDTVRLGIAGGQDLLEVDRSLGFALQYSIEQTSNLFLLIFDTFNMLFVTEEVGVKDLSGPVGIFTQTASVASHGVLSLLRWTALLSVNIGILNLLPLPALDGGRIIFVLIEAIIGRPVNRRIEAIVHSIGLLAFFAFFIYVTFNDIVRLF